MAVMFCDIAGFSTLMGADEQGTMNLLEAYYAVTDPCVPSRRGKVLKRIGDGHMVWFASAFDALFCAVQLQKRLAKSRVKPARRIQVRIGINAGDVIVGKDNDLYGTVVNIAKRLESAASPGGLCVSENARLSLSSSEREAFVFQDAGLLDLKGSPAPMQAWHVHAPVKRRSGRTKLSNREASGS